MAESKSAALPLGYAPTACDARPYRQRHPRGARNLTPARRARQGAPHDPPPFRDRPLDPPMSATDTWLRLALARAARSDPAAHGGRHSRARHGRGRAGAERPSRHAHGHGRCRHRAVEQVPQIRSRRIPTGPTATASCCRPGHGSMLLYALLHLTGYPDMTPHRAAAFPPARQPHRRPSRARPRRRHRDHHRPAGPGARQRRRHGAGRAHARARASATIWSITTPTSSPATAASWRACRTRRSRSPGICAWRGSSCCGTTTASRSTAAPTSPTSDDQFAPLRRLRLGRRGDRRPRHRRHRRRDRARARTAERPSLIACRTIDRLRRADQGRHRRGPWRAPGRGRDRRRTQAPGLGLSAVRDARRRGRGVARRRAGAAHARDAGVARALRGRRCRRAQRVRRAACERLTARRHAGARSTRCKAKFAAEAPKIATRQASGLVLDALGAGDARAGRRLGRSHRLQQHQGQGPDAWSRATTSPAATSITACASMRMAAAMNGMAVHGGIIPYGGTFLVFTDYCRPAIRLSALMRPARHLCDDARFDRPRRGRADPSADRASGQPARHARPPGVPPGRRGRDGGMLGTGAVARARSLRSWPCRARRCRRCGAMPARTARAKGAYVLAEGEGARDVTLLATGSEVSAGARGAQASGRARHRRCRRVDAVLGAVRCRRREPIAARCWATAPRLAVEAASPFGWERYVGDAGRVVGMTRLRRLGAGGRAVPPFRLHRPRRSPTRR